MMTLLLSHVACREPGHNEATSRGSTTIEADAVTEPAPARAAATSSAPAISRLTRPRTKERAYERHRMVRHHIEARGVRDPTVLEAIRNVPRHWFVPPKYQSAAYVDRPLPIGHDQTISQPYIVALMTELLGLKPGEKVLEIGTGSGYQAAVLSELTDEVYTIEIVEPLAERTMKLFNEKGYHAVRARIGDGYRGWPAAAPFDAIIVTCAPDDVPKPLVEQLAIGGRMCIPVGSSGWAGQELVLLTKEKDGTLKRKSIIPVRFVPMTGEAEEK